MGSRSQELVTKCSKVVGRRSVEGETAAMPLKSRKDPIESFTKQGGSLGFGISLLIAFGLRGRVLDLLTYNRKAK